jgi:hypothetical protein
MCLDDEAQLVLFTALDVIEFVSYIPVQKSAIYPPPATLNSWQKVSFRP